MNYVIKAIPDMPTTRALIHGVKRDRKHLLNNITFGFSDKLNGVISETLTLADAEPFMSLEGFQLIDISDGTVVREGQNVMVAELPTQDVPEEIFTNPLNDNKGSADEAWLEDFKADLLSKSEGALKFVPKDELKRALGILKISYSPDAKQGDLVALVLESFKKPE